MDKNQQESTAALMMLTMMVTTHDMMMTTMMTMVQTQEMWSVIVPMAMLWRALRGGAALSATQALLLAMFLAHYLWRSFAYPWLCRGGKPTPSLLWLMASAFCICNGYLQVLWMSPSLADGKGGIQGFMGANQTRA
jgi:hypothetical protein